MNPNKPRALLLSLLAAAATAAGAARAGAAQAPQPGAADFRPVELKLPKGYMPAPFPEKRKGQLLLAAGGPAGMYIVYPKEGESPEEFTAFLKSMVAGMFFRDPKPQLTWAASPLPPHKGVEGESGTLYSASDDEMEVQLAAYTRNVGGAGVAYGYYAMRHKGAKGKEDGQFLDAQGNGVKEFEKFCRSIRPSRREGV